MIVERPRENAENLRLSDWRHSIPTLLALNISVPLVFGGLIAVWFAPEIVST